MQSLSLAQRSRQVVRVTAAVLLLPFLAMQFSAEVNWGPGDFLLAGVLLFAAGMLYQLAAVQLRTKKQRLALGFAVLCALLLIWAELAVGLFH
ncbi:hypothetical protein [Rheinheimera sp.]|uniref:hypothetical protein n=1 Tax=Rheinheimera sp. TaxID=1869214 RepID=UPI00307D7024